MTANAIPPDLHEMLKELAAEGGRIDFEIDRPFPIEVVRQAERLGLVTEFLLGGMASCAERIELTPLGRRRAGLPPLDPWYRRVWLSLNNVAGVPASGR